MNDKKAELIGKVLKDPAYKAELLKDPKASIEKALGVRFPAGVQVKVVEDTASVVHLVLPAAAATNELSDRELGAVSGGAGLPNTLKLVGPCDNTAGRLAPC